MKLLIIAIPEPFAWSPEGYEGIEITLRELTDLEKIACRQAAEKVVERVATRVLTPGESYREEVRDITRTDMAVLIREVVSRAVVGWPRPLPGKAGPVLYSPEAALGLPEDVLVQIIQRVFPPARPIEGPTDPAPAP